MKWYENHLSTCGTSFRGCDPNCPKEIMENKMNEQEQGKRNSK